LLAALLAGLLAVTAAATDLTNQPFQISSVLEIEPKEHPSQPASQPDKGLFGNTDLSVHIRLPLLRHEVDRDFHRNASELYTSLLAISARRQ
jgi:hypothetical protein